MKISLGKALIGGGTLYIASTSAFFFLAKKNQGFQGDIDTSNVQDPNAKTKYIYDALAPKYDQLVGWDEVLMGVSRLRKKLVRQCSGSVLGKKRQQQR